MPLITYCRNGFAPDRVTDGVGLAGYIEWAAANNIVGGYGNGKFGPYDTLTQYAFGKMLLAALGYDASVEGYTGAGWQKNVYRDATNNGIYDGTESYAACTRDDAARMTLAALTACKVEYGYGDFDKITVKKATETTELWRDYGDLWYAESVQDIFGRPGHAWEYTKADFDAFYVNTPVLSYTTKVSECDVLKDLGVSENSTASRNFWGHADDGAITTLNVALSHDSACKSNYGDSGVGALTEIYSYERTDAGRVTTGYVAITVDTYLAKVADVHAAQHGNYGNEMKLDVYTAPGTTTTLYVANNGGYVKGDYVLVNYVTKTAVDNARGNNPHTVHIYDTDLKAYAGADNTEVGYMNVLGKASSFEGKLSAVTTHADMKLTVNGTVYSAALEYNKSVSFNANNNTAEFDVNRVWFLDQYGNVIGDVEPEAAAKQYGRIDAIRWNDTAFQGEYAEANLVTAAGTVVTETAPITVKKWGGKLTGIADTASSPIGSVNDKTVAQNVANNANSWIARGNNYGVVSYTIDSNGKYTATKAGYLLEKASETATLSIDGDAVVLGKAKVDGTNARNIYVDNETQYLVYTGLDDNGNEKYEAYVGYNVPDMDYVTDIVVVPGEEHNNNYAYAEFVYVHAPNAVYAGATTTVYAFPGNVKGYNYTTDLYAYEVYVGTEATTVYSATELSFNAEGIYEIKFNSANEVRELALKAAAHKWNADDAAITYPTGASAWATVNGWKYYFCTNNEGADAVNNVNTTGAKVYKVDGTKIVEASYADIAMKDLFLVKFVKDSTTVADTIYIVDAFGGTDLRW